MAYPVPRPPVPPLIAALFDMLPPTDCQWPIERRAHWLRVTSEVLALVYGGKPDEIAICFGKPGEIIIEDAAEASKP